MSAPHSPEKKAPNAVRAALAQKMQLDDLDVEAVLERFSGAYERSIRQHYTTQIIGTGISTLYFVKSIGLRLDLVFFDVKIFEVPYGNFVFCILAQFFFIGSCLRLIDARSVDRQIKTICELKYDGNAELMYYSYKGAIEWTDSFFSILNSLNGAMLFKSASRIIGTFAALIMMIIFCLPIISGFHFIDNIDIIGDKQNFAFQHWSVLASTVSSILFLGLTFVYYGIDYDHI
jgi:hypothetical protein